MVKLQVRILSGSNFCRNFFFGSANVFRKKIKNSIAKILKKSLHLPTNMKRNPECKKQNYNFHSLLLIIFKSSIDNLNNNSFWDALLTFYKIWPPFQWITSLLTLVLMYWISGYYYNRFLYKRGGGWMDWKTRIVMIFCDLLFNFSLGIYYMNYRETFLGTLMLRCPVFCSPIFWLLELISFYIYYRYFTGWKRKKKLDVHKK